ncbi:TIGR03668 family PPOX class F420-dependent oxidoreductase [Jiangella alkaliphila]|uniref:PPOX class probable F420-dependent enzyme, Rv0121 family n=1 Tax=Jiangella alkaliphila TaxID=419479 RepID=A0A1H2GQP0_9ACTN|nr:TIGR03668 family PPOX class F420-dependent oxidoreductase [Jiangella alkaliphila]SDU21930.1 PPOX class probable F420-dependent enzyme, Rv0121 family [Jiangella alkaliphila]
MRLTPEVCRQRMAAARVAHLATTGADGRPHLVPITFALVSASGTDRVAIAVDQKPKTTLALQRLRNIAENPFVAIMCDHYDEDWTRLWWVRADGRAVVLDDGRGRDGALVVLSLRYGQYRADPPRGPIILIEITAWSGWSYA